MRVSAMFNRAEQKHQTGEARHGVTLLETLVVLVLLATLLMLSLPYLAMARETARQSACRNHLRSMVQALENYHETHGSFPPAANWAPTASSSLLLHQNKRVEDVSHANWAILLLPFLGNESLAAQYDPALPIGDPTHTELRTTQISTLACPSDVYSHAGNPHVFHRWGTKDDDADVIQFARGNYGLNGGSQNSRWDRPNTAFPNGEIVQLHFDREQRKFAMWGNGLGGFNRSFSRDDVTNAASSLIAFDELRAGIHPLDPRGAWALGQIGSSVTWAHGVNGDAYGPNNRWVRADDLLGCAELHRQVASERLLAENMPCVDYVDANEQAAARSSHPGGVNAAFLDGSVRFISEEIESGLWHVLHSRETPSVGISQNFETQLAGIENREADVPSAPGTSSESLKPLENSIGMEFVVVPAGSFRMGIPDLHDPRYPPEVPPHHVELSSPYLLGRHEVTVEEYERVMGTLPAAYEDEGAESGRFPVRHVSWYEASEFCQRLSELPEEQAAGRVYRLPTEAEWEFACREATSRPYHRSGTRNEADSSGEAAGIRPALPISEVGQWPSNPLGLADMRGNVWEWCSDWYGRDYYSWSRPVDPAGPASGHLKVVRGGDWRFVGEDCHIDFPMLPPWKGNEVVGFRVVVRTR